MNAVIIGVLVMLVLSVSRIHVVLSLVIGGFAAGLAAGVAGMLPAWRRRQAAGGGNARQE